MLTKEFINPQRGQHPAAMGFTNTVTYTHGGVKTIVISASGWLRGRQGWRNFRRTGGHSASEHHPRTSGGRGECRGSDKN